MNISICKWYNNALSPVLFFIDDFANVWVDINGNGKIDLEEDWGYARDGENSSFRFLNEVILKDFPYIKTTFFMPVGIRVGMIENPRIKSISRMINYDEETKAFFRSINNNPKYEIAYHGTTHGKVGKNNDDFIQEWKLYKTLDEAVNMINSGKEIYKDVFDYYPKGGKYCGYSSNKYSDESIDKTGFIWWCRFCNMYTLNVLNTSIYDKFVYGEDTNKITNFEIKTFGNSGVVDIPSTLDGSLLTEVLSPNIKTLKGMAKVLLKKNLIMRKLSQINFLLKNNLVISIQEHISPARDDGRRQKPNIFDDRESLKYIFNYLEDKNVWYCTGTELAEYYLLRNNIKLTDINDDSFKINYIGNRKLDNMKISLKFNKNSMLIIEPNGNKVYENNGIFNINVTDGLYKVRGV